MEINLLPWRDEIIAFNKKFMIRLLLIAAVVGILFLVAIHSIFFKEFNFTQSYTSALESQKMSLSGNLTQFLRNKKTQDELKTKIALLEKIQTSRFETVDLLNGIARIMPNGVYITQFSRTNNDIQILGAANSNLLIAQLMKDISAAPHLEVGTLQKVENSESQGAVVTKFDLKVTLNSDKKSVPVSSTTEKSS